MIDTRPLEVLAGLPGYVRAFTDAALWTPYVQAVLRAHGLSPVAPVRVGVPGTCPVFLVADRWVVKFFGALFEGGEAYAVEREAARLIGDDSPIPVASVAASGELGGRGWPWPYLVFDFIDGVSIGSVWDRLSPPNRLAVARRVGQSVKALHALPLASSTVFPQDNEPFRRLLEAQRESCRERHRDWGVLPKRLLAQIDAFLPATMDLVDDGSPPHLIHADLTRDHLLGSFDGERWLPLALIDFGDAMTGSLFYELAALYFDMFNYDRGMLRAFLDAYQPPASFFRNFPRRALATALLHRFNMLERLPAELRRAGSLNELAVRLWETKNDY